MTKKRAIRAAILGSAALLVTACTGMSAPRDANVMQAAEIAGKGQDGWQNLLSLAERMGREGQHSTAIPIYRELSATRTTARVLTGLGTSLNATGRHSEAATILGQAVQMQGATGHTWHNLGKAWMALGRYDESLAAFVEASNRLPGRTDPRAARGIALAAMGRVRDAVDALEAAKQIDPSDVHVTSNLALVHALTGNGEKAVDLLEPLARDNSAGPQDRQNLALAYLMAGDTDKAYKMSRVDLDDANTRDTFTFYRELMSLEPAYRMQAMITGAIDPAWSKAEAGNLTLADSDQAQAAAARIAAKPAPAPAPIIPPLVDPEGWAVQIGAYRTIKNLVRGWSILFAKNKDILSKVEPRRSEKDFGERDSYPRGFYYRLNAGPLETFAEAKVICDALKERGTDCWIRPPEPTEGKLPKKD